MRQLIFLLCLALAATAVAEETKPIQFLDRTNVEVPKAPGSYGLLGTHYDAAHFYSGVATQWVVPGAPSTLRLDIFVYPRGRVDEASAVQGSIQEVEAAMQEAARQGIYSNVRLGERVPFVVVKPDASILDNEKTPRKPFDPTPKPELKAEPSAESANDPLAQALADSMTSPNSHGLRQSISFDRDGGTWRSAAFVFYRHLFLFKVRVSVPVEDMPQDAFDKLADNAARDLVPRIDVQNFGTCGTIEISTPGKGGEKDEASMTTGEELIRGIARIKEENCATGPGKKDAVAAGHERVVIDYPPKTWKSGD